MCACLRFDTSPSGAISAWALVACSIPSQNGQTYDAGFRLCAGRMVHQRASIEIRL
jgi:hypothetical protein